MKFTLIYLVFCIVYHLFWTFDVCFYLVDNVQVERSKSEQRLAKRSQKKKDWANHESMPQHEVFQSKTRGWHAAACQGGSKTGFSRHAAACQIMPRHDHDNQTMLFLASRV